MHFLDTFDFNKQTSLYIHVPFCKSKCSYCAFYSKPECSSEAEGYFNRLIEEIALCNDKMKGRPYYTAFIGGGNPGCLSVTQLETIGRLVCQNGRPEEFSIEMNPESLTKEHFQLFEKYFTRLSMGVQSVDSRALSFLGRNASYSDTIKGINLALELRSIKFCDINFDLITCLPEWHDPLNDVKTVVEEFKPDHLSLYSLTLEEGTRLFNQNPKLPDSDRQYEILTELWHYLSGHGYEQYEVSNFAQKGKYSKHNSVYWDYQQYIGLGPAAASTAFSNGNVYRIESPYSVSEYVGNSAFSTYNISELSFVESLEEFVLMGMRHFKGLDLVRLKEDFGRVITFVPKGYQIKGDFLIPDSEGILVADWAASEVLRSIDS